MRLKVSLFVGVCRENNKPNVAVWFCEYPVNKITIKPQ